MLESRGKGAMYAGGVLSQSVCSYQGRAGEGGIYCAFCLALLSAFYLCTVFFVLFLALLVQLYLTPVCLQYGEGRRGEACAVLRCNCSSCEAPIHSQSQAASRLQPPALPTPIHSCTEYHVFVPVLREPILRQLLRQNDFEQNSGD